MRTHGALTEVLGRRGGDARVGYSTIRLPVHSFIIPPSPQLPFISLQLLGRDFNHGPRVWSWWLNTRSGVSFSGSESTCCGSLGGA